MVRKHTLSLLVVVAVLAPASASARVAGPRTHRLAVYLVGSVVIPSSFQQPTRTVAGAVTGSLGPGAVTYVGSYPSAGTGRAVAIETMKFYFDHGTVRLRVSGFGTVASDGSEVFTGSATILGGTGRFAHARGMAAWSGTASAFSDVTHLRLTHQGLRGSIKY